MRVGQDCGIVCAVLGLFGPAHRTIMIMTTQGTPMTLSRRRITPYAAGLIAALALAACSSGGPAASATPAGPTSTAVPSAPAPTTSKATAAVDPVLARIPAAARPETMEGAEAYATFFMDQVNVAFTRADDGVLTGLFRASCKVCSELQKSAADLRASGQRHTGLSIEVTSTTVRDFNSATRTVLIWTTQHSVPVVNASGETVRSTKGAKGVFLATLDFDGRWHIDRMQVAK